MSHTTLKHTTTAALPQSSERGSVSEVEGGRSPSPDGASVHRRGLTLDSYAQSLQLPAEFLAEIQVAEISVDGRRVVTMRYLDRNGEVQASRHCIALSPRRGTPCLRWRKNTKLLMYGLWRLSGGSTIALVTDERDAQTLWYHGIEAVAATVPWNEQRDAHHLRNYQTIHVVLGPTANAAALLNALSRSGLRDRVVTVDLGGFDGPSAVHVADQEQFAARWQQASAGAVPLIDTDCAAAEAADAADRQRCRALAECDNILDQLAHAVRMLGAVGVEREAKILALALTSRIMTRPVSVAVKGPSSGGKSFLVSTVLTLFPPEAYHALASVSERALIYDREPLAHRILVIQEADGIGGEVASHIVRVLLSEGRFVHATTVKTADGSFEGRTITKEGPTGLIVTTTRASLHPENESRMISISVPDTPEQTRAVLKSLSARRDAAEVDVEPWHALQRCLARRSTTVAIPFADALVDLIPPIHVRLRRDVSQVLTLIRAHALLHQFRRERDGSGAVVATLADYAAIRVLVADSIGEGVGATVSATVRETVQAVERIAAEEHFASVQAVAQALVIDKSAASRRCKQAQAAGYIFNSETSSGRPARYRPAEALPEDRRILPPVDEVERALAAENESGCTVAQSQREASTPLHSPPALPGRRRREVEL